MTRAFWNRSWRIMATTTAFVLVLATTAAAQNRGASAGGGGKRGGGSGSGGSAPPPPVEKIGDTGTARGVLVGFEPAEEGGDEEVVGKLRFKVTSARKTLALDIRKKDNVRIMLGNKEIPAEEFGTVLLRGLQADVGWDTDKVGTRKVKYVRNLSFVTLKVDGSVEPASDGDGNVLVVKGKPADGTDWPSDKPAKPNPGGTNATPKKVQAKKLKIHYLEGATVTTPNGGAGLSPSDLEDETHVTVEVVLGKTTSLFVSGTASDAPEKSDDEADDRTAGGGSRGDR